MSETTNDAPAAGPARKRNRPGAGRPPSRTGYATLYRGLQQRVAHARNILEEAARDETDSMCCSPVRIALKTLNGEE